MQQAKLILPMIHTLLAEASLTFADLNAIAYGCGPGSFTGIRIANSVAQGIAFAAQKPVIQVSSLAILAQAAFIEHSCTNMLVAVDARMNQIYWAFYTTGQKGYVELIGEEHICAPDAANLPEKKDWRGVGDGWDKYTDSLTERLGFKPESIYASQLPTAQALLQLANVKFEESQWVAADQAAPVYLR
jgi:tRNA threonylcarbamoyladenosine biosynthesis protein TsaB